MGGFGGAIGVVIGIAMNKAKRSSNPVSTGLDPIE
jgi:hypothetical protein